MVVPAARIFFAEVRAEFGEVAAGLGLDGPVETETVLPVSKYTRGVLEYGAYLDQREASLQITAGVSTETTFFTAGVEQLAIAAGIVEKRGGVSFSARNLKQMKKSLAGQLRYVELLHPLLSGDPDSAVELMRKADAREWRTTQGPAPGTDPGDGALTDVRRTESRTEGDLRSGA